MSKKTGTRTIFFMKVGKNQVSILFPFALREKKSLRGTGFGR